MIFRDEEKHIIEFTIKTLRFLGSGLSDSGWVMGFDFLI